MMEKRALTESEKVMLIKLLMGGAMAGGAAGLATSFGNQIKTLHDEANRVEEDPIITLPALPENPYQTKYAGAKATTSPTDHTDRPPGIVALSLALPAIGLPALFTYAAARKAHQLYKKKELEKELANSEEAYIQALQKTASEEASVYANPEGRPFLDPEIWGMLTAGVVPLSGLAAAYMTNKILDKSFPVAKKPRQPRRIRIRRQAPQPSPSVQDSETSEYDQGAAIDVDAEEVKEASYYDLDESDAVEFLVRTVLGNPKVAAASELPDLILNGSADYTRTSNMFIFRGVDAGFRHVKSASKSSWADSLDRAAGIHLMSKSASLGPSVALLAAAEFAEAHPMLCSQAAHIDPRIGEELIKFAALHGAASRVVDVERFLSESGEEDFAKTASAHTATVTYIQLGQLCQEKRAFAAGKEKVDVGDATWAGGIGGLGGPIPAALVAGAHSGISSDSLRAGGMSAFGGGGGSLAGAGIGTLLGSILAAISIKSGEPHPSDGAEAVKAYAEKALGPSMALPILLGGVGSVAGGALGSRWAANKHNKKVDEIDARQAAIMAGRRPGASEDEKSASANRGVVPTHDAINITESRSSQAANSDNSRGDDPIIEGSEEGDIVDQAMTELAGTH